VDQQAWQEQVEAALESGDPDFLGVLAGLAPSSGPPELELVRCRLRLALGDAAGAAAALLPFQEVEEVPALQRAWAAAAVDLALAGASPNVWGLGRALTRLAEQAMERRDSAGALDVLERHIRAALGRGAHAVAVRGLELAESVVDPPDAGSHRLSKRRRKIAEAALAELGLQIAAHVAADPLLPDSAAALLDQLGGDPERDIDRLHAAFARWPDQPSLLHSMARAWEILDDEAAGIDAFARALAGHPDDVELATAFGWHLVRTRRAAELEALVDHRFLASSEPSVQARGHWLLARARLDRAATGSARASLGRMLALEPHSIPGRHLLAQVMRAEGQPAPALELLDTIAADAPQDLGPWHWDRMELGTALGSWASVRDSAARLGMPVEPGTGPIDERWSHCRVLLPWADPDQQLQPALRTGPVTARLIGLQPPSQRQRYGDVVIFRAEPVEPGDHPEGPLFRALEVIHQGHFTARALSGQHPGEEAMRAMGERLHAHGVPLQWWVLAAPDAEGKDLHVRAGLPPEVDLAAVEPLLAELEGALAPR